MLFVFNYIWLSLITFDCFLVSTMSDSEDEFKKKCTRDPVFNEKEDEALIRVSFLTLNLINYLL